DLRAIARLARDGAGDLVILYGDIVTNREALAGLVADPRIVNGALIARGTRPDARALRVRGGIVVAAASDVHRLSAPDAAFLGVVKVGAATRELLAATAERVAPLAREDVVSLLLVGLVRAGVPLRTASLRGMVWERAASEQAAAEAAAAAAKVDED